MKRFSELNSEELAKLNSTQIEELIDLEIAHAGIQPVPPPAPVELKDIGIIQSDEAYAVGNLIFANEEDAKKVAEMATFDTDENWQIGYEFKWLKPVSRRPVERRRFYKQADIEGAKALIFANKEKMNSVQPAKDAYDNFVKETSGIRNKVFTAVQDAHHQARKIELARETWQKHLRLADNDRAVAEKFFRDAYKNEPEIIKAILHRREGHVYPHDVAQEVGASN